MSWQGDGLNDSLSELSLAVVSHVSCACTHSSTCGMFMSSIKQAIFLPIGGPYVSLVRFSTAASRVRCTSSDEVLDEKLIFSMI